MGKKVPKAAKWWQDCSGPEYVAAKYFPEVMDAEPLTDFEAERADAYNADNVIKCPTCGEVSTVEHKHEGGAADILTELTVYAWNLTAGMYPACKKHVWAAVRFLNDLKRSEANDPDFPYYFDAPAALRFINWVRLFKHRKGILKGQYIEPDIILKFIFGNVYGWKNRETGYRRFSKLYWQVGRKNAKSQACSCVGTYETAALDKDQLEASEVYIGATKRDQAAIVYGEAVAMVENSAFREKFTVAYGKIRHKKTGSIMRALSEEDRKTGDGLNPQCGIIDEYHAHDTAEIYDILDTGMGARAQPLLCTITTAGFDLSNPCYRVEYDLCSKILNPDNPTDIDNYFVMINELDKNETDETVSIDGREIPPGELIDDINDETVWAKANPILCSYEVGINSIRKSLKEAKEAPEKMANHLTKRKNVWVNQREFGYMNLGKWAACGASKERPFPDIRGLTCRVGIDLSSTIDLTSCGFVFDLPDGEYAVRSHSFIPREKFDYKIKVDKVPYHLWEKQGYLTVTSGAEVDYNEVLKYINSFFHKYELTKNEFCYDRALATWLKQQADEMGFFPVDIPQTFSGLSNTIKVFRAKVYNKKVIHENDPLLTWAMGNAITRAGPNENLILDKAKSKERFDPVAALINAAVRAIASEDIERYAYAERGVRSLG